MTTRYPLKDFECEQCGDPFKAQKRTAKWCSTSCKKHSKRSELRSIASELDAHADSIFNLYTASDAIPLWRLAERLRTIAGEAA